jgi:tetratricopeptide (TPR) repeat protein
MSKLAVACFLLVFLAPPLGARDTANDKNSNAVSIELEKSTDNADAARSQITSDTASGVVYKIKQVPSLDAVKLNTSLQHYYLAQHYFRRLDFNLADIELQQALAYKPDLQVAHRDLCLLAIAQLRPLRALAEFLMVVGLYEAVPPGPFEKAELDARAAKLHYAKALSYGEQNRWGASIAELKRARAYSPDNLAIERSLAFAYASNGQFDLAEQQYENSFAENNPDDAYYHADFAFLLSKAGKKDNAIEQLRKAIELKPNVAALHVDLAWLSENQGDLLTARTELKEAIRLSPNHASLWAHLSRLLDKTGKSQEAKEAYKKALSLDPQLAQTKEALAR